MEYKEAYSNGQESNFECLLFDIDDTIYPLSSGLAAECKKNIQEFMAQKLGIEESKIPDLCALLYEHYGTTMAGLRAIGYDFDYDEYHSLVHGRLPYERLKPDPVLRGILLSLPTRKVIFTNADKIHAAKVINRLGLEGCFEKIICFETLNSTDKNNVLENENASEVGEGSAPADRAAEIFDIMGYLSQPNVESVLPKTPVVCKPSEDAIEQALKLANINPKKTIFFDDSIRNIQSGKRVGLHTVLVGNPHRTEGVDYAIESIHNIREALPQLWEADELSENVIYAGKVGIETQVSA